MKKKQFFAALTAALCCMGAVSVPSNAIASATEQVQSYAAQANYIDTFKTTVETYMNDNNISGKVYTEGFKASDQILVEVMSDSDAQLVKSFIETEGKGTFYIDFTYLGEGRGIRILAAEETLMNIRGNVSQFMEENNIIGYTYISADSNVITVVCNSNEDIEHIKAYVAEKCYRAERLEYTLPDFEVSATDIAPTDLEEIRQILDDFIKQNGISGYTKIAPRKGEDKVWLMLDSVKDENYRKIELFMNLYGIDSDSVIIDTETTLVTEAAAMDNSATTGEQTSNVTQYADSIDSYMKQNNISGSVYTRLIDGVDKVIVLCENYEDQSKVKDFVLRNGIDENTIYYDFYTEENSTSSQDISEDAKAIDSFMQSHNIAGYAKVQLIDGVEKIIILCEKPEEQSKVKAFVTDNGIDESSLYYDYITDNNNETPTDTDLNEYVIAIEEYMNTNSITGSVDIQKIDGSDMVVVLCNDYDDYIKVKGFVESKGYDENQIHFSFTTAPNDLELSEYVTAIDNYMKQNNIAGSVDIQKIDGTDKVVVTCDEYDDHFKIKEYADANRFDSDSIVYSFKTYNHIASDDELAQWAIKDYQDKTGVTAASAEVKPISDDKYEIVLKDADGNILDTYTINPETGIGTNSSNDAVDLPQTGNNSTRNLLTAIGAVLMIVFGAASVKFSGVLNRRKRNEK